MQAELISKEKWVRLIKVYRLSIGHDCIALPCHKFEDPIICESLMGNDTCLCKEMHTIGKCQVGRLSASLFMFAKFLIFEPSI